MSKKGRQISFVTRPRIDDKFTLSHKRITTVPKLYQNEENQNIAPESARVFFEKNKDDSLNLMKSEYLSRVSQTDRDYRNASDIFKRPKDQKMRRQRIQDNSYKILQKVKK